MVLRFTRRLVIAALFLVVSEQVAVAQVSDEFKALARILGDAVLRADDQETLALSARIRALGEPVGVEIEFAEAQALMRMHRNEAAEDAISRYLANGGKLQKRAKAIQTELNRRKKAISTSWRRDITARGTPLLYADGSYVVARWTNDDLAEANIVVSFHDANGDQQWRTVYGGAVANYMSAYIDVDYGRIVVGGQMVNGGWRNENHLTRALAFELDPLGRVRWQFNPQNEALPGEIAYYGNARYLVADGVGGFVMAFSLGGERYFIERYAADGSRQWRQFYQGKSKNDNPDVVGLARDGLGNFYAFYDRTAWAPQKILKFDKGGRLVKELRGSPVNGKTYEYNEGYFSPDNLRRIIMSVQVSEDGSNAYFLTKRYLPDNKGMVHEVHAVSLSSGQPLWLRSFGLMPVVNRNYRESVEFAVDGKDIVIAGIEQASSEGKKALFVRKYSGASGTLLWERRENREEGAYGVDRVQVFPSGMALIVAGPEKKEIIHLAALEFEGLDDPLAEPPAVAFLPYSENSDARAEILYQRAVESVSSAEAALRTCREGKVSENVVGRIREVRADWGFVILDLNAGRGLKSDMSVRLADGTLIGLKPGKEVSASAVSASPISAPIEKLTAGMDVVASGDIPDALCPSELAGLEQARKHLTATPRPASR